MTRDIRSTRPARAAIAAVLAFSATPLLAQEVAPSPVAPVVDATVPQIAPVVEAAPPTPAASAPVMAPTQAVVQPTPSVEDRKAEAIAQAEAARIEATPAPVKPAQQRSVAREAASSPVKAEPVAVVPARAVAPAALDTAPVTPAPVTSDMAASDMAASNPAEPVAIAPPVSNDAALADNESDALTWGLAGGALLLLGAAGTMAMRRRRTRAEELAYKMNEGVVSVPETPVVRHSAEPAFAPAAATAVRPSIAAGAPYGSLAAMADASPSPSNPFLTRKNRLRRAHFLLAQQADGTEHMGAIAAKAAPSVAPVDRSQTVYSFGKDGARRSGLIPRTR